MSFSAYRKASQYRPEAVLLAEEIQSRGIEVILEQRFYREKMYHCEKHRMFEDEKNEDTALCPICSMLCSKAHYQVDIFLPNYDICLEIKGKAHDSETQQEKDQRKEKYLKDQFGVETISARAEWFLDSKKEPRYEWIVMYSDSIVKLIQVLWNIQEKMIATCV